jgi:segregation and condensation protein B
MENIKSVVEAIIFSSGSPVEKKYLIEKIPSLTTAELNKIVKSLRETYGDDNGIVLVEFNGKLQFTSNPKFGEAVADVLTPLKEKSLTRALLEVLATIAYRQPITRAELDDMRGTSSEYALSGLLKAKLIDVVGRKDTVGRPLLYGTTDEFLRKFQLENLDDLPDLVEVMEKLQQIYTPPQDTLFHSRSIFDEDGAPVPEVASDLALEEAAIAEIEEPVEKSAQDIIDVSDLFEEGELFEVFE